MKIAIYFLIALAVGLLIFNVTKVDWSSPFEGQSTVALIGVIACACAVVLLLILRSSRKIAAKSNS